MYTLPSPDPACRVTRGSLLLYFSKSLFTFHLVLVYLVLDVLKSLLVLIWISNL